MATTAMQPVQSPAPTTDAPRKRRRRTPAAAATEDCYACRKRGLSCDRKRPYCSQCVEQGKECSGYKTTLTWGVGVASRGKLRGLTCPVANKNPSRSSTSSESNKASPAPSKASSKTSSPVASVSKTDLSPLTSVASTGPTSAESFDFNTTGPLPQNPVSMSAAPPPAMPNWHVSGFSDHLASYHSDASRTKRRTHLRHPSLQRIQTTFAPAMGTSLADQACWSAPTHNPSWAGISSADMSTFPSPYANFHTPLHDMSFIPPPMGQIPQARGSFVDSMTSSATSLDSMAFGGESYLHPGADDLSSNISSDRGSHDFMESPPLQGLPVSGPGMTDFMFDPPLTVNAM